VETLRRRQSKNSAFSDVDRITGVPREIRGSRGLQPDSPGRKMPPSTSDHAELLKRLTATDDSVVVPCVPFRHPAFVILILINAEAADWRNGDTEEYQTSPRNRETAMRTRAYDYTPLRA